MTVDEALAIAGVRMPTTSEPLATEPTCRCGICTHNTLLPAIDHSQPLPAGFGWLHISAGAR